jgi:soluble cytochrome b562
MAIIFPEGIKGHTAGSLRQLKQYGMTSAAGGFISARFIRGKILAHDFCAVRNFNLTTGGIKLMDYLNSEEEKLKTLTSAIAEANRRLSDTAKDSAKQMADVSGKFRDGAEKLSVAIDKMTRIAARPDYIKAVETTVTLVEALERLAALEERGALDKVMQALK